MINYFDLMFNAIMELQLYGSQKENLRISISPLVEFILKKEIFEAHTLGNHVSDLNLDYFMGIEVYKLHPYNEIVVFDKTNFFFSDKLIIKIKVEHAYLFNRS